MKTLLTKFYKSLACRVALAIVATATVAKAHDLPQHFPLAPTDWGMIQQDCLGLQNSGYQHTGDRSAISAALDFLTANQPTVEITFAQPDLGNPPEPIAKADQLDAQALIGPELYDGIDCAKLESYYRNSQSNQQSEQLVEYKPKSAPAIIVNQAPAEASKFEFHKSFFAACSCDFEHQQANQSILPPKLTLKRTYVEDHFANEFNCFKPLLLRDASKSLLVGDQFEQLAIAIPATRVQNKELLNAAFSQYASYDCIVRSEVYSSRSAFALGELLSSTSTTWFTDALPSASSLVAEYANNLKPASKLTTPAPMFVILQNAAGHDVAIPIAQAKEWEQTAQQANLTTPVPVSQEFRDLINTANTRLQWAGGRLSAAASFMNDWFSDRMARAKSNDLH
ncbi:MAG: hypothetical protein SFV81_01875 [Pirellulaceae bacterium]|nr:hypothetical protein [Pirellulaceae bacterium]